MARRVNRVLTTNSGAANTGTTMQTIVNNDILIFDGAFGTALTGTPGLKEKIFITEGLSATPGAAMLQGAPNGITTRHISKITSTAYVAPTAKVMAIGFNGTSGTITAPTNNTLYVLNIVFQDDQRPAADARQTRRGYYYTTSSAATTQELVNAMVKQINADQYMNGKISATELTDGSFAALTNNATVTNGSDAVASTAHGLAKGDLVRIGGTGATAPVYQVDSVVDANNFNLTSKYQGTSGTVLAANIGKMTASANFGIRLAAQPVAYNGIDLYMTIAFDANLVSQFTLTHEPTSIITAPVYGKGYWQQVRDQEYFAQGYESGPQNRTTFPDANVNGLGGAFPTRAIPGGQYNVVVIEFFSKYEGDFLDQYEAPCSLTIAFDTSSSSTKLNNFLATIQSVSGVTAEIS